MSGLLASVRSVEEAEIARREGADIIDLKDPNHGALAALPAAIIAEAVAWAPRGTVLSATAGDLPMQPVLVAEKVAAIAALGVGLVKLGLYSEGDPAGCLAALAHLARHGTRVVIVLFADRQPDFGWIARAARAGLAGIMLDTADKRAGGLRRHLSDDRLAAFVGQAREHGLIVGLAGSLGLADIAPLKQLQPDYLGFRGALCAGGRSGSIDAGAIRAVRQALGPPQATAAISAAMEAAGAQRAAHSHSAASPVTRLAKST
jgi:(5-formylfuran-3-yl)methyl phosphate synthase